MPCFPRGELSVVFHEGEPSCDNSVHACIVQRVPEVTERNKSDGVFDEISHGIW